MRGCLIALLVLFMVPVSLCAMITQDGFLWFLMIAGVVAIVALLAGGKAVSRQQARPEDNDG